MVKNKTIFLLFLLVFSLLILRNVIADGGYFPHPGYYVSPGEQRAVIFYEDNIETMIVTSSFKGNAKDLVWIIPTPTRPEITKASEKVFNNVQKLVNIQYSSGFRYDMVLSATSKSNGGSSVVVLQSKQVDYYDVNVLSATSSDDLVKWFNENNYSYPDDYSYVLKSYIARGWYFTAIKVSPEAQGATEVIQDLKEGNPTPVKIVFSSDKIVFPLKISSVEFKQNKTKKPGSAEYEAINSTRIIYGVIWKKVANNTWITDHEGYEGSRYTDENMDRQQGGVYYSDYESSYSKYVPIYLYVITNGKYQTDNSFYINYGNWVSKKEIEKLGTDDNGNSFIQPKKNKYFLTYLTANMQKSQMDDDLIFEKSENNKKINAGPENWQLFLYGVLIFFVSFIIWIVSPFGLLFIPGILILFFASNNVFRVFGWVMSLFSFILTILIGLIFFVIVAFSGNFNNYVILALFSTYIFLLILISFLIFLEVKYRKASK
jgi:hypothetical protein